MLKRFRRSCLHAIYFFSYTRNVFVEGIKSRVDQVLLTGGILFLAKIGPVLVACIGAADDCISAFCVLRTSAGVVEAERAAGNVAAEKRVSAEQRRR